MTKPKINQYSEQPLQDFSVRYKITGRRAHFHQPYNPNKTSQLTDIFISPAVAISILEKVYWKPEYKIQIDKITICSSGRPYLSSNDLGYSEEGVPYFINEEVRMKELSRENKSFIEVLPDVCYVLDVVYKNIKPSRTSAHRHIELIEKACLSKKYFQTPNLGCESFTCDVSIANGFELPAEIEVVVENALHSYLYDAFYSTVYYTAVVENGVIETRLEEVEYRVISKKKIIRKNKLVTT